MAEELNTLKKVAEEKMANEPLDLLDIDPAKHMAVSTPCAIRHPLTKKDTGQRIWLFGKDSPRVRDYIRGEADALLAQQAEAQKRGQVLEPKTMDQLEASAIRLLTVATDRWENVCFGGQQNVPFTHAAAAQLYKVGFVREQLSEHIEALKHFMKG